MMQIVDSILELRMTRLGLPSDLQFPTYGMSVQDSEFDIAM
ncbi:hypothetical protein [Leptospira alexanderi]|nr:hypothetical protein [Leptospira alexanderi]